MKTLVEIDKFYYAFGVVSILLTVLIIFTLRAIFSSLSIASNINSDLVNAPSPRINESAIEQALAIYDKNVSIGLDLDI